MSILWHGKEMEDPMEKLSPQMVREKLEQTIQELQKLLKDLPESNGTADDKQLEIPLLSTPQDIVVNKEAQVDFGLQGAVKKDMVQLPKPGDILKVDTRVYRWTEVDASPAQCQVLEKAIKGDEVYMFDDTYAYHNGSKYVKLFKKDITNKVMAEDEGGIKFPNASKTAILTQWASEEAAEIGFAKFQKDCNL